MRFILDGGRADGLSYTSAAKVARLKLGQEMMRACLSTLFDIAAKQRSTEATIAAFIRLSRESRAVGHHLVRAQAHELMAVVMREPRRGELSPPARTPDRLG